MDFGRWAPLAVHSVTVVFCPKQLVIHEAKKQGAVHFLKDVGSDAELSPERAGSHVMSAWGRAGSSAPLSQLLALEDSSVFAGAGCGLSQEAWLAWGSGVPTWPLLPQSGGRCHGAGPSQSVAPGPRSEQQWPHEPCHNGALAMLWVPRVHGGLVCTLGPLWEGLGVTALYTWPWWCGWSSRGIWAPGEEPAPRPARVLVSCPRGPRPHARHHTWSQFCVCGADTLTFPSGNQNALLETLSSSGDTGLFIRWVATGVPWPPRGLWRT